MKLRGYRRSDSVTGYWLPGELLATPLDGWPALVPPTVVAPANRSDERLCVLDGLGFVRFTGLDWVRRRARLEIGVRESTVEDQAEAVRLAVAHGFDVLNLHRLVGWRTPAAGTPTDALCAAGFGLEGVLPGGNWLAGSEVERQVWGVVRDA
jgi:hypothetical protein